MEAIGHKDREKYKTLYFMETKLEDKIVVHIRFTWNLSHFYY